MAAIELLKQSSFFKDLNDEHLSKIVALCKEQIYRAQDFIFKEGEEARRIYVLADGAVAIQINLKKYQNIILSTIEEKGELFGWSALVDPKYYRAATKCLAETRVLSICADELESLFKDNPFLGLTFMQKIAALIDQRFLTIRNRLISSIS